MDVGGKSVREGRAQAVVEEVGGRHLELEGVDLRAEVLDEAGAPKRAGDAMATNPDLLQHRFFRARSTLQDRTN